MSKYILSHAFQVKLHLKKRTFSGNNITDSMALHYKFQKLNIEYDPATMNNCLRPIIGFSSEL